MKLILETNKLTTIKEACEILETNRTQIWRMMVQGYLTPMYVTNRPLFSREEVEQRKAEGLPRRRALRGKKKGAR